MSKKILITGGTGFIGYHLAKKCLKLNWSVTSLSTKNPKKYRTLKKVKYLICDISNKIDLQKKIKNNYDYVVNLAGYVDHTNKIKTTKSHFQGCKNISLLFVNSNIKKFVQIGSSIEYGKIKSPQIEFRSYNKKILSTYGKAKLSSTNFLLSLYKNYNFPAIILRLYLVYGPNQEPNRIIPYTILNSLLDNDFHCSSGKQYRDFLYIDDLISAIIKTLRKKELSGEIINIGSGQPIQIKKVILKILNKVNLGNPKFGKIGFRRDEIMRLYPSINKALKKLNWVPRTRLDLGLDQTIKYFKKNKYNFLNR